MNQQDDSIRSLAARRGLIAAGALMALYIIAAVVYTFVMLHPVLIAGRKLFWLGAAVVCVYFCAERLTLYRMEQERHYLAGGLIAMLLFVLCAVFFASGFFYTGV